MLIKCIWACLCVLYGARVIRFYVSWQVREDEISELEVHMIEHCPLPVKGGVENNYGKINILLQTFISKGFVDSFSLVSDLGYVAQVY